MSYLIIVRTTKNGVTSELEDFEDIFCKDRSAERELIVRQLMWAGGGGCSARLPVRSA